MPWCECWSAPAQHLTSWSITMQKFCLLMSITVLYGSVQTWQKLILFHHSKMKVIVWVSQQICIHLTKVFHHPMCSNNTSLNRDVTSSENTLQGDMVWSFFLSWFSYYVAICWHFWRRKYLIRTVYRRRTIENAVGGVCHLFLFPYIEKVSHSRCSLARSVINIESFTDIFYKYLKKAKKSV